MKIRRKISFIVLPLIIVPLIITGLASAFAARNGITQVTTEFLSFKAEELLKYAENQWSLLVQNALDTKSEYISVSKSAVESFAKTLVRTPTERIFALTDTGTLELSTGELSIRKQEKKALLDIIRNDRTGWTQMTIDGVRRVAQVLPFTPFGWYFFITEEEGVFYNSINRIYLQTGIILTVFLIIALFLLIIFTGHMTRPLRMIAGAMTDIITSNDFSKKVEILYDDETGDLANAFNIMTTQLQKAYDQIKIYALETAIAQKHEEKIRHIFQKYVPKDVIDRFIKAPASMLVGEDRLLAVLFSDIRQFTTISEQMKPKEIVDSLNNYFGKMVNIIFDRNGIVDKYIGDAIMAFFGAPVSHKEDAYNALESGFQMLEALKEFNENQVKKNGPAFNIGIGISYGIVTVGNIGSEKKMDYTVIGDIVNLTSRLEGLTKKYREPLLISETMYREVVQKVPCRLIDRVAVKGKSIGIGIYTARRKLNRNEETAWRHHHIGLLNYYNRDFGEALSSFRKVLELLPGDTVSKIFIRRCEEFTMSPPGDDWNGIYILTEK